VNQYKYLHRANSNCWYLDHRLTPEVRAMFCAMASRLPEGGIYARYNQVVQEIVAALWAETHAKVLESLGNPSLAEALEDRDTLYHPGGQDVDPESPNHISNDPPITLREWATHTFSQFIGPAEDLLTVYPLHPRVQAFFDEHVGKYGHSSILELTGSPSIYVENVSWFTNYLLFDQPLCAGQEFSTRAIRRKNWPMCSEAYESEKHKVVNVQGSTLTVEPLGVTTERSHYDQIYDYQAGGVEKGDILVTHRSILELEDLHQRWLDVFEHEVPAWAAELRSDCVTCQGSGNYVPPDSFEHSHESGPCISCAGTGKKYPFITDPQAFRPALDRARFAIPGTVASGSSHTANLRVMARSIQVGKAISRDEALKVWEHVENAYKQALPGLSGLGLRDAVHGEDPVVPGAVLTPRRALALSPYYIENEVELVVDTHGIDPLIRPYTPPNERTYVDAWLDRAARVTFKVVCSLAVLRDWHRHRSFAPWAFSPVKEMGRSSFVLHPRYTPLSDLGKAEVPKLLEDSWAVYRNFINKGDLPRAMLAIPFGAAVYASGQGGLSKALYMFRLRANARGANFEYEAQAKKALALLIAELPLSYEPYLGLNDE